MRNNDVKQNAVGILNDDRSAASRTIQSIILSRYGLFHQTRCDATSNNGGANKALPGRTNIDRCESREIFK